jgi:hypothetical protein
MVVSLTQSSQRIFANASSTQSKGAKGMLCELCDTLCELCVKKLLSRIPLFGSGLSGLGCMRGVCRLNLISARANSVVGGFAEFRL